MAVVVVNNGVAQFTSTLLANLGNLYIAIGTGAGTAAATDAAMFTEDTTTGRTLGTLTRITKTVTNDTLQLVATVTFSIATENLTEVGIFTAATGGTMIYHRDGVSLTVGTTPGTTQVTFTEQITL